MANKAVDHLYDLGQLSNHLCRSIFCNQPSTAGGEEPVSRLSPRSATDHEEAGGVPIRTPGVALYQIRRHRIRASDKLLPERVLRKGRPTQDQSPGTI